MLLERIPITTRAHLKTNSKALDPTLPERIHRRLVWYAQFTHPYNIVTMIPYKFSCLSLQKQGKGGFRSFCPLEIIVMDMSKGGGSGTPGTLPWLRPWIIMLLVSNINVIICNISRAKQCFCASNSKKMIHIKCPNEWNRKSFSNSQATQAPLPVILFHDGHKFQVVKIA